MTPHEEHVLAPAKVWDLPVRLFHWLLLIAVATAAVTGFLMPLNWINLHLIAGTLVGALLLFRLVWGFSGSGTSRFASFLYAPREVMAYLQAQLRGDAPHVTGHNPAGAVMIFALLGMLAALVVTGTVVLGGAEKQGPLQSLVSFDTGAATRELHEWAAIALLVLIGGHLTGIAIESWRSRENLPRSMVTGWKRAEAGFVNRPPRRRLAAAAFLLVMLGVAAPLGLLWQRPAAGVPAAALDAGYAKDCGDCHNPFHPSLLAADTWRGMMASLDDHFGEDASLPSGTAATLTGYLAANSAEHWDTRAAHVFRAMNPQEPYRITASEFWTSRHHDIDPALFKTEKVGTKSNCEACHGDARLGLFTPQAINIPKE